MTLNQYHAFNHDSSCTLRERHDAIRPKSELILSSLCDLLNILMISLLCENLVSDSKSLHYVMRNVDYETCTLLLKD